MAKIPGSPSIILLLPLQPARGRERVKFHPSLLLAEHGTFWIWRRAAECDSSSCWDHKNATAIVPAGSRRWICSGKVRRVLPVTSRAFRVANGRRKEGFLLYGAIYESQEGVPSLSLAKIPVHK